MLANLRNEHMRRLVTTNQHEAATHEGHVNLLALSCLSREWRDMASAIRQESWNKKYLDEARELLEFMQSIDLSNAGAYVAHYTDIVNGLRHLQVLKDENLQRQGIATLHAICFGDAKYRTREIFDVGGLEVIIGAMVMHPTCVPLIEKCCRMMGNMAKWRGEISGQWSSRHSKTAVRVLVDAMRRFPRHVRMHNAAVQCLTTLSTKPDEEPEDPEETQILMPQIYQCRSAILELGGLKAALLGPVDADVCLLLAIFVESEGNETGRWQQVAGRDCIPKVVAGLMRSTVLMHNCIQDDMIPNLQYARASIQMLAKLCQNAHNAEQFVAASSTLVFLDVLSVLRRLQTHFSQMEYDFIDLTCPDIVIPVLQTLVNTLSMDGREQCRMVVPIVEDIVRDTRNVEMKAAGRAVLDSFAHAHPLL